MCVKLKTTKQKDGGIVAGGNLIPTLGPLSQVTVFGSDKHYEFNHTPITMAVIDTCFFCIISDSSQPTGG